MSFLLFSIITFYSLNVRCRYDPKNYTFVINLRLQKPIILEGLYEVNGKVLVLPITGNGTCRVTLGNLN